MNTGQKGWQLCHTRRQQTSTETALASVYLRQGQYIPTKVPWKREGSGEGI